MTKEEELEALARGDSIQIKVTESGRVYKTIITNDDEDDEPNIIDYLHEYHNYDVKGLKPIEDE